MRKPLLLLLLSCVQVFDTPWTVVCQSSLSFVISWVLLKLVSIALVMSYNQLILWRPLLLLPSFFPSTSVFSNESALCIRWPKHWSFSVSFNPRMNIQDWFPLGNQEPGKLSLCVTIAISLSSLSVCLSSSLHATAVLLNLLSVLFVPKQLSHCDILCLMMYSCIICLFSSSLFQYYFCEHSGTFDHPSTQGLSG